MTKELDYFLNIWPYTAIIVCYNARLNTTKDNLPVSTILPTHCNHDRRAFIRLATVGYDKENMFYTFGPSISLRQKNCISQDFSIATF